MHVLAIGIYDPHFGHTRLQVNSNFAIQVDSGLRRRDDLEYDVWYNRQGDSFETRLFEFVREKYGKIRPKTVIAECKFHLWNHGSNKGSSEEAFQLEQPVLKD